MPKRQPIPIPPKGKSFVAPTLINNGQKAAKPNDTNKSYVRGPGGRG